MFKLTLVDNWKKLLTHSLTMQLIYAGTIAEIFLQFFDVPLPLWARILVLGTIGAGRLVQQNLAAQPAKADDDDTQIPLGI